MGYARIRSQRIIAGRNLNPSKSSESEVEYDEYLSRLIKLIPSEVVALYLTGRGFALSLADDGAGSIAVVGWAVFCTIAVILVRYLGTKENGSKSQLLAVLFSTISFLVWVYSIGDVPAIYGVYFPSFSALLVMAVTFLIPLIYKGD